MNPVCRHAGGIGALLIVPAAVVAQALPESEACITCHLALKDSALAQPALSYAQDVHAARGFGCLACHGGPVTARGRLDPSSGFLGRPERREVPGLCGRCHSDAALMRTFDPALRTDQVSEYESSIHGRRLRERDDPDVATCVSCHPAHEIRPPSDPESSVHPSHVAELCGSCHADRRLMDAHDLPSDELDEYRRSVHGKLLDEEGDLSAPTCNDCHGNHGAAPPGVSSVRNVCGQCHATMAEFFDQSGHAEIFASEDLPGCATCHGNHLIEPTKDADLETRTRTVCRECHEPGDQEGAELLRMAQLLDSLGAERRHAERVLEDAENLGMEVSQAIFELEEVNNALTKARTAIHSFHESPVEDEVRAGFAITEAALGEGVAALTEHRVRRLGLAASSGITLVLIACLIALIRGLERREPAEDPSREPKR